MCSNIKHNVSTTFNIDIYIMADDISIATVVVVILARVLPSIPPGALFSPAGAGRGRGGKGGKSGKGFSGTHLFNQTNSKRVDPQCVALYGGDF